MRMECVQKFFIITRIMGNSLTVLLTGSRITTFFNFGYVALTIKHVTTHDIGVYTCRAYNRLGQATTSAQLTVVSKKDIILDSQHPGGLEKIHYLEDTRWIAAIWVFCRTVFLGVWINFSYLTVSFFQPLWSQRTGGNHSNPETKVFGPS